MKKISVFRGKYAFLSNFYHASVVYEGILYPTAEHAFQAAKTTDLQTRLKVFACPNPVAAKHFGRYIKLRPDWELIKVKVMHDIVYNKFKQNEELRQALLGTGDAYLEECNTWHDTFWGVDSITGKGCNHLGEILMTVRKELR